MKRRNAERAPAAVTPGPGQESVWDYPRPPRVEPCTRLVEVRFGGLLLAASRRTLRVLETSHPPAYYVPFADVRMEWLVPSDRHSWCEWKGLASYFHVVAPPPGEPAPSAPPAAATRPAAPGVLGAAAPGSPVPPALQDSGGRRAENAAWHYPDPTVPYKEIRGHVAFYPQAMDACLVDGEVVAAQPGDFYGGWITRDVVGPFKGAPGTSHW